jgi:hypothetical protein
MAPISVDLRYYLTCQWFDDLLKITQIKGAEELGAVGVLIYSDPRDDGNVTVQNGYAPYPAGPARNPTSVQRGSVQFISKYPGDPTTPGYPAYENSTRTEASSIPKIPSLPISWTNAERLLEEIGSGEGAGLTGNTSETTIKMVNHGLFSYDNSRCGDSFNLLSGHQGYTNLEYHGCHSRSHQR